LARDMSSSAYAVYVFHTPIVVLVALGLRSIEMYPLLKFALASLICLPACFVVAGLAKRLPIARTIL
jgi:glucan biosynthesis protein C